jgi:hypothetical protein
VGTTMTAKDIVKKLTTLAVPWLVMIPPLSDFLSY